MKNDEKVKSEMRRLYICGFLIVILSIVSSYLFFNSIDRKKDDDVKINSSSNIDYSVQLIENDFYEETVLPADKAYIASLIKDINASFNYNIKSTEKLDYDYTYSVEALIKVYEDSTKTKTLLDKSETILEEQKISQTDTDSISINQDILIDYNEYNKLISSFKTSYLLNNVADVTIVLHVNATAKSDELKKEIKFSEDSELVIPLTEQTIDVEITKKPSNNYNVLDGEEKTVIINKAFFIVSVVLDVAILSMIIYIIILAFFSDEIPDKEYKKILKKLLNEYDLIIANVKDDLDETKYEVINVDSFIELKDVHDNVGSPILFREVRKGKESKFTILKDNILYKYVLKSSEVKKK